MMQFFPALKGLAKFNRRYAAKNAEWHSTFDAQTFEAEA